MVQKNVQKPVKVTWKSSLRTKTLLTIIATFLGVYIITTAILNVIVLRAYEREESRDTTDKVNQALASLRNEMADLANATTVIAQSTDTYTFMQDKNTAYQQSLQGSVVLNNRLNYMMLLDSADKIIFSKGKPSVGSQNVLPADLTAQVKSGGPLLTGATAAGGLRGVVVLTEGPMLVAAKPIVNDDGSGTPRGTVVFLRALDAAEITQVSEISGLPVTAVRTADTQMQADFQTALKALSQNPATVVQRLNTDNVAGYTLVQDIYGAPALVLKVTEPRLIYAQGVLIMNYFALAGLSVVLISIILVLILLDRFVVRRIARLSRNVSRIGEKVEETVPVQGRDEVSYLAGSINSMLGRLAESEQALRHLASFPELNPTPIVEMDMDGKVTYLNIEARKLFPDIEHKAGAHPYLAGWDDFVRSIWNGKETVSVREVKIDDSWYGQTIHYVPVAESIRFYGRDITAKKRDEVERQHLFEEERKLRQDLESEIKKRVEFTRALVHELKTPLTPIIASSDLLLEEMKEEPYTSLAKNVSESALRLNQRIDELLDLARGEVGMMRLKLNPVDPLDLIQPVLESMVPASAAKKQHLVRDADTDLPRIVADSERIQQVLSNMVSNAIKFAPVGGTITVGAKVDGQNLVLSVHDTGVAISDVEKGRIFEAYRPSLTDRDRLGGLGLGLALSKMLVELHGGKIWVTSEKDNGNTFGFSLPIGVASQVRTGQTGDK